MRAGRFARRESRAPARTPREERRGRSGPQVGTGARAPPGCSLGAAAAWGRCHLRRLRGGLRRRASGPASDGPIRTALTLAAAIVPPRAIPSPARSRTSHWPIRVLCRPSVDVELLPVVVLLRLHLDRLVVAIHQVAQLLPLLSLEDPRHILVAVHHQHRLLVRVRLAPNLAEDLVADGGHR